MSEFSKHSLAWLETVFEERFGHRFQLRKLQETLVLRLHGAEGTIVFDCLQSAFHNSCSNFPCGRWGAMEEGWRSELADALPAPGVYHLPVPLIDVTEQGYLIHFDIPGLVYWMLTRLEEVGRTDLDEHGRFPAVASHAFKYHYLDRPIVDEWLSVLGQVMKRQWPSLVLKHHEFNVVLTHDVDSPSRYGFRNPKKLLRAIVGDVVLRREPKALLMAPWIRLNTKTKLHPLDPYNTFDWIMDQSEEQGIRSAFYFMSGSDGLAPDSDYEIEHPAIRSLIRRIHERGHEVGLHPTYNTYKNPAKLKSEAQCLKKACEQEGVLQQEWGGRMHYLRWDQPTTLMCWEDAGMTYDSTLGYADTVGFRCGTCHEYVAFNPVEGRSLSLRLRPLISMESSVLSENYMNINHDRAIETFLDLKEKCKNVGGCFTLLWHNSELYCERLRKLYLSVIK